MEKYTEVFYWGSDTCGQFGVGDRSIGKNYSNPKCCSFCIPIKKLSCGDEHSGFIAANGYVYMMGSNKQGRLGISNPSLTYASRPLIIEALADYQIIDLSCGSSHTAAVTTSGLVFTWGNGTYGALGHSEAEFVWAPKKVNLNSSIVKISCGARHVAAISEEGTLVVWGAGEAGQLGLGNRSVQKYPAVVQVGNIVQVSCGVSHTLVLLGDSSVLACGGNSFGQLGVGIKEGCVNFTKISTLANKNVVKIAAGQHSAAITAAGDLYVWGSGVFGEFLQPTKSQCSAKMADLDVGIGFGIAIDRNGTLWGWGCNNTGCLGNGDLEPKTQPYPIIDLQSKVVTQVSCGNGFTMALGRDLDVTKTQISQPKSKNTDLSSVLEEMKKEMHRLQKGTGGLEDLTYKLEQSKIKQNHVQNLLYEEIRQKEHFEEKIKNLDMKNESLKKELNQVCKENQEIKEFADRLENEIERKDFEIEKIRKRLEEVENDHYLASNEKQIAGKLSGKIEELEKKLQERETELREIKTSSVGIVNHNSVLAQEIKEIPVHLSKIQGLEKKISELVADINEKKTENQKLEAKTADLNEEIKGLKGEIKVLKAEIISKDTEKVKTAKIVAELQTEKQKSSDLTAQVQQLEEKLQNLEHGNFLKLENYSKELALLNERLNNYSQEIEYYKEINNDQDKMVKKIKLELKTSQEEVEVGQETIRKLEEELTSQSSKNKEFLNELTKQVASRAESYKTLNMSFNQRKTMKRVTEEDDIELIYAKP